MKETVRMIVVLTLISTIASFGLATFNEKTAPAIANNEREYTLRSIVKTLPETEQPDPCETFPSEFDNKPDQDAVCIDGTIVYRGRKDGKIVGLAVVAIGDESYSGTIRCLVGLDLDGRVTGLEILAHAETPGLGARVEECTWRQQLVGKRPDEMTWKVSKDGGDIDQLSGATISSRSVVRAVTGAQKLLTENKDAIVSAEPLAEGEVCDAR